MDSTSLPVTDLRSLDCPFSTPGRNENLRRLEAGNAPSVSICAIGGQNQPRNALPAEDNCDLNIAMPKSHARATAEIGRGFEKNCNGFIARHSV